MNTTFYILLVSALILIGVTTYILFKFSSKNSWWKDWVITCVSVLVSALIAIPIGLSIYRSQIEIESAAKRDTFVSVIRQQIKQDLLYLQNDGGIEVPATPKNSKRRVNTTILSPNIFNNAANSYLFGHDLTWSFINLSREIESGNLWLNYFMSVISNFPIYSEHLDNAILNLDIIRKDVIKLEEEILNSLPPENI